MLETRYFNLCFVFVPTPLSCRQQNQIAKFLSHTAHCNGWVSQPTSRYPPFIFSWFFCVHVTRVCLVVRTLPGLAPGCAYLLVALCRLRQPFTPVHSSRALELRMCKLHFFRVEFSWLTCMFRTKSDWICEPRAFPVRAEFVVREFGRT